VSETDGLNPEQRRAATAPGSVAVTAGAGTGKTYLLARRYLHHLHAGLSPLEVVAVTFTDKAAAELRARIRTAVAADPTARADWLAEVEAAPISTLHSLAARICREHPEAADVPAQFGILDEIESALWADEQLDAALDGLSAEIYERVPYSLLRGTLIDLLRDPLTAEQALAATDPAGWPALAAQLRAEALAALTEDPVWRAAAATLRARSGADGDVIELQRRAALQALAELKRRAWLDRSGLPLPEPLGQSGNAPLGLGSPETPARPEPVPAGPRADGRSEALPVGPLAAAAPSGTAEPVGGISAALAELAKLSASGGKAKAWAGDDLPMVKQAIKDIRDRAKAALKDGLATVAIGPADDALAAMLPALREAFVRVRAHLAAAKRRERRLDFADLEVHALRALGDPEVRAYYAERWRAILVDEFQDTNPIQGELLQRLTGLGGQDGGKLHPSEAATPSAAVAPGTILTIVGDVKQSIYGFRRADPQVFGRFRTAILAVAGTEVVLGTTYRTHAALVDHLNQISARLLGEMHQALAAHRSVAPGPGPHLELQVIGGAVEGNEALDPDGAGAEPPAAAAAGGAPAGQPSLTQRRRVEARQIAARLRALLASGTPVHDRATGGARPVRPSDVAILARTWDALETISERLEADGIPAVLAGGGNLLEAREAKDGEVWLRFLADPADNLALAALLRGPAFAISDRVLYAFAQGLARPATWWEALATTDEPSLRQARTVLVDLLNAAATEPPSELLRRASGATGYGAVIANLPNATRREADWRGFVGLVRTLEAGNADVRTVARRLKRLRQAEVAVPRPPLQAGNAVSLLTIHAAKGLEWPVVVVADLTRRDPNEAPTARVDADLGVALRPEDDEGERQIPVLYRALQRRAAAAADAEACRLLYVALTRARDYLILSGAAEKGGNLDRLLPGLDAVNVECQTIPFTPADALPPNLADPPEIPLPTRELTAPLGSGLLEIPATALNEYAICPRRFRYRFVDGHPGLGEGAAIARRVGHLTHIALEQDLTGAADLARLDPGLPPAKVAEALALAERFATAPAYAALRSQAAEREARVALDVGGLRVHGVVDRLGPDFVLDFKTDQQVQPQHHRFQLWAYARATNRPTAVIAYLRHDLLLPFDADALAGAGEAADAIVRGVRVGHFPATPSPQGCAWCPYAEICDAAIRPREEGRTTAPP
jgi:ATP-dependent helicase/nuclease subunit A